MAGTTGTAGMTTAMDVCTKANDCKVQVIGDDVAIGLFPSVEPQKQTDMSGYRKKVSAMATAMGFKVVWVGSKMSGGTAHDGITMAKIADVTSKGPALVTAAKPNIVIINVGGWDVFAGMASGAKERADAMIDAITAAAPAAHVVVVGPPPGHQATSDYTKGISELSTQLASSVMGKKAAGKNVSFNTLVTAFNNMSIGRMAGLGLVYDNNAAAPAGSNFGVIVSDNGYGWIAEVMWAKIKSQIKP
jgi:hypothetical protein